LKKVAVDSGTVQNFPGTHTQGALRGHLCGSSAFLFSERQDNYMHAIARYMLSPVRPSVTRVDQSKTAEVRIMQLSPQSSPMIV